jgi:hypothetical protein
LFSDHEKLTVCHDILAPFYTKNRHFTKTGSGQTSGKLTAKREHFAAFVRRSLRTSGCLARIGW